MQSQRLQNHAAASPPPCSGSVGVRQARSGRSGAAVPAQGWQQRGCAPSSLRRLQQCAAGVAQQRGIVRTHAAGNNSGGLDDDSELDVAVFRFTLGIPGFDDRLIPRVVGLVVGAALALNHLLSAQPVPEAQVRAEFLGALLVALCLVVPELEERLRSVLPGRGRQQGADAVEGAARVFALAEGLSEGDKRELAWLTFALLKNVNCCGAVVLRGGGGGGRQSAAAARGALGGGGGGEEFLAAAAEDIAAGAAKSADVAAVASGKLQQLWLPDRGAMAKAGADAWRFVPRGAQSLLLQAAPGGGLLAVVCERPRGLPDKDRKWVAALAQKLA